MIVKRALALVCSHRVVWKPSEKTPLNALAVDPLYRRAAARFGPDAPKHLCTLLVGGRAVGEALVDPRVAVLSATGSTRLGRVVGERLARRFAKPILKLGGNIASIRSSRPRPPSTSPFAAMGTGSRSSRGVPTAASGFRDLMGRLSLVGRPAERRLSYNHASSLCFL